MCADGSLDARYISVESEHSAMAACIGASAAGVRTFTATSSQGLALMHELLHWAALGRHPVVMADVNRAMGPGWNIWTDQNDSLSQRDTGWIQLYCETNQEVLDTTILGFKLAEAIDLPVMVVLDAFFLSHTAEPVDIPDQELVDGFLPRREARYKLDVKDPHAFGALVRPDAYMEMRLQQQEAMERAHDVFAEIETEWEALTGRGYGDIEGYRTEGADLLLVTSSTITSTAREVVDARRDAGEAVGLVKVKMFRPFPTEHLRALLSGVSRVRPQHLARSRRHIRGRASLGPVRRATRRSAHPVRVRGRTRGPRRHACGDRGDHRRDAGGRAARARGPVGGSRAMSQLMIKDSIPQEEHLAPGHLACPGCAAPLAMKMALKALGDDTMVVLPACCWSIIAGPWPQSSLKVPLYHTAFETGAAEGSGV
jgi:pyruvate/2-oxoacid:ferredoxin oxidoreductase alpha subunit